MTASSMLHDFIAQHHLPPHFEQLAETYYQPLADRLERQHHDQKTLVVGINGCQGSGKSTLTEFLQRSLADRHLQVAALSIDDLYLTRDERQHLAETVHPLLKTRGVPGTHDVDMGIELLDRLQNLSAGQSMALPRFDKARDDRLPEHRWPTIEGPIDILLFEGWCVGSLPQDNQALKNPVNTLEAEEDPEGIWRSYVNAQLAGHYQTLFSRLQCLIMLKAPGFDCVYQWRLEQEQKLARKQQGQHIMPDADISRFIQHYQRLTEATLDNLPERADVLLTLNNKHQVTEARYR